MESKAISITNSQGRTISASVHYPNAITNKLAILLPGYLDSKDYSHLVGLAEDLSRVGYTAVRVDLSGAWESGENIEDYTITQHLKDVKDVIEHIFAENKYEYVVIGGHSRGGFIAMLYALTDSRISAVVGIMSPYALARTINDSRIIKWKETGLRTSLRDIPGNSKEKKEFKVPFSNIEDARSYNLLNEIDKLHCPLLLITGEFDDVVLPTDLEKIYKKAREPKKFVTLKDVDHDYRYHAEYIQQVDKEILEFLKNYLNDR